jgi:hypothetical protein
MNFDYNSINSATELEKIEKAKSIEREIKLKRDLLISNMATNVENQEITQEEMLKMLFDLVKMQNDSNEIIEKQCNELIKHNTILQQQNESQTKELKKQKIWNWITYGITTVIAIVSVVATFISIFR